MLVSATVIAKQMRWLLSFKLVTKGSPLVSIKDYILGRWRLTFSGCPPGPNFNQLGVSFVRTRTRPSYQTQHQQAMQLMAKPSFKRSFENKQPTSSGLEIICLMGLGLRSCANCPRMEMRLSGLTVVACVQRKCDLRGRPRRKEASEPAPAIALLG